MATPEKMFRNDEATKVDRLDRDQYANAFAKLALTCDPPLVVGLYGGWGVGKTSLMRLIEKKLDQDKTCAVWFDPWQHQFDDNPVLALLHTVVDTCSIDKKVKAEVKKILTVVAGAFGSMFLKSTTGLNVNDVDSLAKRYEDEKFQVRETRVRLRKYFEEFIKKVQGKSNKTIVFFIDDLDRCMPNTVLKLLESLKLYLNLPGCVYFLGVDHSVLEKSIHHHYEHCKDIDLAERDYLDKIVQLPFTIPPITSESMEEFIKPLLSEGLKNCLELLEKGLGDNPRRVKRFINTLTLNHLLASEQQIDNYDPKVLALLLLIQYRKPKLYRKIAREPMVLVKLKYKNGASREFFQKHLGAEDRLKDALNLVKLPDAKALKSYIYLTQVAKVSEEDVPGRRFNLEKVLSEHKLWLDSAGEEGNKAELGATDLRVADLEGANLSKANLSEANLNNSDLSKANLSEANLNDSDLGLANLRRTNLNKADLLYAFLEYADLSGADLRGADLRGAELRGATGLTKEQIDSAITDEDTILPDYLKRKQKDKI